MLSEKPPSVSMCDCFCLTFVNKAFDVGTNAVIEQLNLSAHVLRKLIFMEHSTESLPKLW